MYKGSEVNFQLDSLTPGRKYRLGSLVLLVSLVSMSIQQAVLEFFQILHFTPV
jgi:hypothetical protein